MSIPWCRFCHTSNLTAGESRQVLADKLLYCNHDLLHLFACLRLFPNRTLRQFSPLLRVSHEYESFRWHVKCTAQLTLLSILHSCTSDSTRDMATHDIRIFNQAGLRSVWRLVLKGVDGGRGYFQPTYLDWKSHMPLHLNLLDGLSDRSVGHSNRCPQRAKEWR